MNPTIAENINANHVIVVHGGAGYHARSSEKQVKEGLRRACVAALSPEISEEPIGLHDLSVQSTVSAIKALEDDETFNAGLLQKEQAFRAKYPVQVASAILKLSQTPDALGRVSPLLLVSQGAQAFAKGRADCHLVEAESMVSPRAKAEWEHWREIIQAGRPVAERGRPAMQDTVGALTFYKTDAERAVTSAGVSSGGILMKLQGRIGECTTAAELASQLRDLQSTLALPETEDNWEKISRAIQKFAAVARGGATKLDPEFVNAIKANYKPITASMTSERGRLSGVAIDFVSSFAPRLGLRFEPLVSIIIPALVKLLMRPNKVFVNRAQTCLLLIIEHCHLPSIVPHLREAVKDKAQTLRLAAAEATLHVLEYFDKTLLEVKEGISSIQMRHRGNVEDIESIIKDTARDANPTVRQASRKVFEKYTEIWPERVEVFTAPFSPTIRKYLNVNANAMASNGAKPVAALKVKPVTQPVKAEEYAPAPAARRLALLALYDQSPIHIQDQIRSPRTPRLGPHHASTGTILSPLGQAQPSEERVTARPASRAAVTRDYRPPSAPVTSRPASRAQHVGSTKSTEQVPTAPVRAPPTRPAPISVKSAGSAEQEPALSSASSTSTFVRVQRPRPEAGLPNGPVRPQGPVRAVSMKDPPLRPVRQQPLSVEEQERLKPKSRPLIDLRRHGTPPREDPPLAVAAPTAASSAPRFSDVAVKVPLPESRPGSALDIASPIEPKGPTLPVAESLASSATSTTTTSTTSKVEVVSRAEADKPVVQAPSRPVSSASVTTPAPLVSSASSASTTNSTTKRPAVLNRRGAAPPPGQTQGFAPTRRRGGVTEPTLAQMQRQKPAVRKPEVPAAAPAASTAPPVKKATESVPVVKKMPSNLNAIPKEVAVAMQTPLPPNEPHGVPLPADGKLPVKVSTTPEPPLDATPRAPIGPRSTTPVSSPVVSKGSLLVDLDQTIILPNRPNVLSRKTPPAAASGDLMDFDVSVVLPDSFAPMSTTHAAFPVLRDHQEQATNVTPIRPKTPVARTAKDPYESEGDSEARVALMEKELNTLRV
ncbi:hypothetical protein FRB90_011108 [Tulasnella sp. 427]|nr:hypothetical protein FRB90_011108 [Tulasnella sp. 427]